MSAATEEVLGGEVLYHSKDNQRASNVLSFGNSSSIYDHDLYCKQAVVSGSTRQTHASPEERGCV